MLISISQRKAERYRIKETMEGVSGSIEFDYSAHRVHSREVKVLLSHLRSHGETRVVVSSRNNNSEENP